MIDVGRSGRAWLSWLIAGATLSAALPAALPAAPAGAAGKPAAGVSHTAAQSAPIQLGTSGGWGYDRTLRYCCGGTLGALISVGGVPHILSNWHVLSADIVAGGNNRVAFAGDPVIHPGLIDLGCTTEGEQVVGSLVFSHPSPLKNVDAAIAIAVDGMVSPDGAILEVGPPSTQTVGAFPTQAVKKSGRTTRLTRSVVTDVFAEVSVSYENECAGAYAFTVNYVNQILVRNRGRKFLNSGDSGSLLLEDVDPNPRSVGLLFAGSNLTAVANPIGDVLTFFGGATLIGVDTASPAPPAPAPLQAAVERAHGAQVRHAAALRQVPDSVGHAVGVGRTGEVVVKVLLSSDSARARAAAPRSLDGVPVEVEVVGRIVAY